jgi:hypothetical protein
VRVEGALIMGHEHTSLDTKDWHRGYELRDEDFPMATRGVMENLHRWMSHGHVRSTLSPLLLQATATDAAAAAAAMPTGQGRPFPDCLGGALHPLSGARVVVVNRCQQGLALPRASPLQQCQFPPHVRPCVWCRRTRKEPFL